MKRFVHSLFRHRPNCGNVIAVFFWAIFFTIAFISELSSAQIRQQDIARISPEMRFLAKMENHYNPVDNEIRPDAPIELEHFEIPLRLAENLFTDAGPKLITDALLFTKANETWIRWIPNPDDTFYKDQLVQFLKDNQVDASSKRRFIGFRTSSRSVLVFDPVTGAEFSTKASTNNTRGNWKDKPETSSVAKVVTQVSNYVSRIIPMMESKHVDHIVVAPEPGGFTIKGNGIDQGMLIRTYPFKKGKRLIPIFSLFHEEFGKKFAEANGYTDRLKFVREKLFPIWIKSIVQFSFTTGFMSNSAHGQNYLVEVDESLHLTGKVIHRDFADARINPVIISRNGGSKEIIETYKRFSENNYGNEVLEGTREEGWIAMKIHFSPVQGNIVNSWFPDQLIKQDGDRLGYTLFLEIQNQIKREVEQILEGPLKQDGHYEVAVEKEVAYKNQDGRYELHFPFRISIWQGSFGKTWSDPDTRTQFQNYPSSKVIKCRQIFGIEGN